MSKLLSTLTMLAWALWFGGTMTLFLAVSAIFKTFAPDKALAGTAAAGVFAAFERFQLPLAIATAVLAILWRVTATRRPHSGTSVTTAIALLLALATAGAATGSLYVSPQIETLRVEHRTSEASFKKLHGASMALYTAEAALLLIAGLLLPTAIRWDAPASR